MPTCRLLLFLLLLGTATSAAEQPVFAPANVLLEPAKDPAWRELFAQLGQSRTRISHFEERRYFPFRAKPVILQGEIRIVPGRGLSLSYGGAKPQMIIIDDKGVLMRNERGRERSMPDDDRARAATSALAAVLRFDLAALEKQFVIHGSREADTWTLGFAPRDAALAGLMGTIAVKGRQAELTRIDLVKSADQHIEIIIQDSEADVIFPPEVLKRFFR